MPAPTDSTKKERRAAAREERAAAERAAAAAELRKRRLLQLGGVAAAAVVAVVLVIVLAGGGSDKPKPPAKRSGEVVAAQTESAQLLAGIPQHGTTLGDPKAKLTLNEFADLQCPVCQAFTLQVLPDLIKNYVRTGKLKIRFVPFTVISPASNVAWTYADGAAQQDKAWNFIDLTYYNQGEEGTSWVTPQSMLRIARGVAGLNVARVAAHAKTPAARDELGRANTQAGIYGIDATPSLLLEKQGSDTPQRLAHIDYDSVSAALDQALKN